MLTLRQLETAVTLYFRSADTGGFDNTATGLLLITLVVACFTLHRGVVGAAAPDLQAVDTSCATGIICAG